MHQWRYIISEAGSAAYNMAVDESIFLSHISKDIPQPTFRLYRWSRPQATIGYFQKHAETSGSTLPRVRRITGGLLVEHGSDVSYSLVTSKNTWPLIHDQEDTYRLIHFAISAALNAMGIDSRFFERHQYSPRTSICTRSIFPHDVHLDGRKVIGSCQRKRGNHLLVQGSVHIRELLASFERFAGELKTSLGKALMAEIIPASLSTKETRTAESLASDKYGSDSWNRKF